MSKRTRLSAKRIFIVEDHPVFREGLKEMIDGEKELIICGEAATPTSALQQIRRLEPDLALVDITLPRGNGLQLLRQLRKTNKELKVLVISMHDEALFANRALLAGADGYIMKQEDPEEILHAIRDVLGGHTYLSEDILNGTEKSGQRRGLPKDSRLDQLTDQELEILEWIGWGKSTSEIAQLVRIRSQAVTTARTRIQKKLGLRTSPALARYAASWIKNANQS